MQFHRTSLEDCSKAKGVVLVIDVLRAFTTAAYAFSAGAEDITLVSSIKDAYSWRNKIPGAMLMGETDGQQIKGFDFGNSPPQFDNLDLTGLHLIQRTTSGTQGAVRAENAEILLAAGFCNVGAAISYIKELAAKDLTFVITGMRPGGWGDEDAACADYIEQMLSGTSVEPGPFLERVRRSKPGRMFADPTSPEFPEEDLEYCLKIDKFEFAMPILRQNNRLLMIAQPL